MLFLNLIDLFKIVLDSLKYQLLLVLCVSVKKKSKIFYFWVFFSLGKRKPQSFAAARQGTDRHARASRGREAPQPGEQTRLGDSDDAVGRLAALRAESAVIVWHHWASPSSLTHGSARCFMLVRQSETSILNPPECACQPRDFVLFIVLFIIYF